MKRKILIFSPKLPYPLTQGGAIAQFFFLKKLIKYYDVTFCTIVSNENQKTNINLLQSKLPDLKINFYEVEIEKRTLVQVLYKYFLRFKARLLRKKKLFEDSREKNKSLPELIDKKIFVFLNELIRKETFDLVQVDFYETLILLPVFPDYIKKIFVHHEIRSKRDKLLNKKNDKYQDYLIRSNEIFERAFLEKGDAVIVFNEEDRRCLKDLKTSVYVSPFGIPDELIQKKGASIKFNKFIFIGGEFHYPNKEGLEWFLDEIFIPNYKSIDWPIYIIGYWSKKVIEKYSSNKGIIFCGYVSDLNEFYEESVMIVPILSGSGIRTKILMALANRIPVFSTEFASEGLLLDNEITNHILLFNNESEFMKVFLKSTDDKSLLLLLLANKGFEFYNRNFSNKDLISKRLNVIETVLSNINIVE